MPTTPMEEDHTLGTGIKYEATTSKNDEQSYQETFQNFMESMETIQIKSDKKYSIERLKTLGATVFEGSLDPADAKACLI